MKDIRLDKLILRDFQGGNDVLVCDGQDTDVYAANGVGKTRLASAVSWLLFGKDSLGRSDFDIKNKDATGQEEHGLEHSVEGELSTDGDSITLKKVYHEVWTKKRGAAKEELTGNTVDHFIDGVPVQEKEYKARIAELAGDEGIFRLITSPTAFPSLHWQKQRELLLAVCGDMTDAQVIASDNRLAPLSGILGKHTIDNHRKILAARKAEINKEMQGIPPRIDEVRRMMPDVTGLDRGMLSVRIAGMETALSDARLRLSGVDNGSAVTDLMKQVAVINNDIQGKELSHYNAVGKDIARITQQINEIVSNKEAAERKARSAREEADGKEHRIHGMAAILDALRAQWIEINAEAFEDDTSTSCPTCGQSLPLDRVQEARDKARKGFNYRKAERLAEIDQKGKGLKEEKERLQKEIDALGAVVMAPESGWHESELQELRDKRDMMKAAAENYFQVDGWALLVGQKAGLEARITAEREGVKEAREVVQQEVDSLDAQLKEAQALVKRFTDREAGEKRIEELRPTRNALPRSLRRARRSCSCATCL